MPLARMASALVASVLLAGTTGTAAAAPTAEDVEIRTGIMAQIDGSGCAPAQLSQQVGDGQVVDLEPRVGEDVGEVDSLLVTEASSESRLARWTVVPSATECALRGDGFAWPWSTGTRAWTITQLDARYALRVHASRGVRSIAGFNARWKGRTGPTVARARRHFGNPSTVKQRYDVSCRVTWKRLGLTLDFVNFGGHNPCRRGYLQVGRIDGPHAARWAAISGTGAGWSVGTSDAYLEDLFIGEQGEGRRWTLAEVYVPYGEGGYIPSLSALLTSSGIVRGYEFWAGAGGD